ncbi:unnamed protein product, partial [Laminaria digitata]
RGSAWRGRWLFSMKEGVLFQPRRANERYRSDRASSDCGLRTHGSEQLTAQQWLPSSRTSAFIVIVPHPAANESPKQPLAYCTE